MTEAQQKRWAAAKKEPVSVPEVAKPGAKKPKRKLSAEGRKRIIEATKKRWAAVRAAASKAAKYAVLAVTAVTGGPDTSFRNYMTAKRIMTNATVADPSPTWSRAALAATNVPRRCADGPKSQFVAGAAFWRYCGITPGVFTHLHLNREWSRP
jgi:hypothetical protein